MATQAIIAHDTTIPRAPAIIRGELVDTDLIEFGGRNGDLRFLAPDPSSLLRRLPMGNPQKLTDMHDLSVDDIIDYLRALGDKLDVAHNEHLQHALELTLETAPTTPTLVRNQYGRLPSLFTADALDDMISCIGREYLEGWVHTRTATNGAKRYIRAFGSRALHIVAGNSPVLSSVTVIRNAVSRSDAIIKAPSNDPFTAIAVARTMIDVAPDHPITKHVSVAYWKGGDEAFEAKLYQPHNIDKIVAWGGFRISVKHVTKYIQPGLELISLDPKRSISVVGRKAFSDGANLDDVAIRIATRHRCTKPGGLRQRPRRLRAVGHRRCRHREAETIWGGAFTQQLPEAAGSDQHVPERGHQSRSCCAKSKRRQCSTTFSRSMGAKRVRGPSSFPNCPTRSISRRCLPIASAISYQ